MNDTLRIQQMRQFVIAAESGSFRAAALATFRSAAAVSTAMADLEQQIGSPLFEQGQRGRLTPLGQTLAPLFAELVRTHDRIVRDVRQITRAERGLVTVAVVPFLAEEWFSSVLGRFIKAHSNVTVRVVDQRSRQARQMVGDGLADIAIVAHLGDDPKLNFHPVAVDTFGIICRQDDQIARRNGRATWKALSGRDLIGNDAFETVISHGLGEWVENNVMVSISSRFSMMDCQLSLLAFQALARRPLVPFGESLRNWCFAASLNGGYRDHHDDFDDLLHFNLADWAATKDALREAAKLLRQTGMSSTGQWALVCVLRATGDSADAEEADRIAEELTKDRERMKGWRRIEDYCATDPCDPASEAPDNIDKTASDYRAINPAELRRFMSNTQDDYFFTTAQPGLARFRPEAAVEVLQALADQAVTRAQPEFRQAVFMLENHTVGLEDRVAIPYVEKASEIAQAALDAGEDKNNEAWVAAQYALSVAFPHMTGDAQFDALVNHPKDRTILLDLGYLFQPIDETKLERALDKAVQENNPVAQFRIFCFAEYSRTPLTARTKEMLLSLLASTDGHVRLSALALIQATADPLLLAGLVKSGWSAAPLDAVSHKVEILHGSQALVLAAEQGSITLEACLDRIALSAYESLAERLGPEAAMSIADRLNTAIHKAAEFQVTGNLPDIEQSFEGRHWSVVFEVSEKPSQEAPPARTVATAREQFCLVPEMCRNYQ